MADLALSCPPSHTVYVDSDGELYGHPLAGTVQTSHTLHSLQVALVRTIRLDVIASNTSKRSSRLKTRLTLRKPKHVSHTPTSTSVQEIVRCNLSTTPASTIHHDGHLTHEFTFALPSPLHCPETIPSGPLEVSYELIATATRNGYTLTDSRPLQLICRRFPDPWDIVTHARRFPGSSVKAEFTLAPQVSSGQCTRYSADIQLCNVASPASRPSELTTLVVYRLAWRLDELITWDTKSSESTTTHTRTLAHGTKKGRWTALQKPKPLSSEQSIHDMRIAIPLEISVGKDVHPINDTDIDAPSGSPPLTVRHQVTIELVTGRETMVYEFHGG
ncbi:hypothetical protein P170DRAFT_462444 [Aspergillus steynii IBT 23096]|uniref:LDB19 N-terminal domain-containing protein n=1 Tax=Aspergillus steynii IBT 23096 TaxID=1392250 RepID=A0A2I2GI59_9EURO|nr:uncharacterized protein P170DRAFT_462444 [Aspergillus steynii IBT 23096]PLB52527.1 hypothetical protein P170DRAFT_462444 [Aspergillus steynii IBT 23096]